MFRIQMHLFDLFLYLVPELSEIFGSDFIYETGSDQLPPLPFNPITPQKSVLYQELCKINLHRFFVIKGRLDS